MTLKLKTPSNGSVTLAPQDTASDVVVTVPAGTAELLTNSSGVLNIGSGQIYKDAAGNVGIGTSSPARKLDVAGGIELSSAIDQKLAWGVSGSYLNWIECGGGPGTTYMRFATGNAEAVRIDSSGNLLVGATIPIGDLTVYGGNGYAASINQINTNSNVLLLSGNADSNAQNKVVFSNGGSVTGSIYTTATTTTYNTSSDYRLKENPQPIQNALATVAQLNPVTWKWKADGSDGQGFIAHELQAVVPDCVTGEKDAVRIVDVLDEDGKKIGTKEEPVYQGVDTSFLVATLTKAIQELNAKVEQLEAQIAGGAA